MCVFKFLIDIFLFCQVVVRYSSHFPTTSGGSTPPCLCIYIDIVEICPDLVYTFLGMYMHG